MKKIHACLHSLHNQDLSILFIRIAIGVVFINAGWMKVNNIDMVVSGFSSMGIPAALAYFVSYAELIGGILVLLGLFTRYMGVILAVIMAVAITKVHFANGFSLANGGYEYTLVLFLACLSVITSGAGKYSIAKLLKKTS